MLTAVLGLAGGIGAAAIGAWAVLRARRPPKARVELVDVSVQPATAGGRWAAPVLDVKLRNSGGQPAVLKRLVIHVHRAIRYSGLGVLMPYDALWVGAAMDASGTYDVELPPVDDASGAQVTVDISQVIAPAAADRFLVRLGIDPEFATQVYLLHVEVVYDAADRRVRSDPVAVAFARLGLAPTPSEIRSDIRRFRQAVDEVRAAVDEEMTARGLPTPDWNARPPGRRSDLPAGLVSVDGVGDIIRSGGDGVYEVNERFWDPQGAIERYLRATENECRKLVDILSPATAMHDLLRTALQRARATLDELPNLHAEFRPPAS